MICDIIARENVFGATKGSVVYSYGYLRFNYLAVCNLHGISCPCCVGSGLQVSYGYFFIKQKKPQAFTCGFHDYLIINILPG